MLAKTDYPSIFISKCHIVGNLMSPGGRGGGGYSDIFIHTKARVIFWVQNFEFQYFLGLSE